jgi:hypothetical protein
MVSATPWQLYPWEGTPIPIVQGAGWVPGPVWTGAKYLAPHLDFFLYSLVLCLYFIRTCFCVFIVLHFAFLSLLSTHNTNIHALGRIWTRNPSKRLTADPLLRPLGHWDRLDRLSPPDSIPGCPAVSRSLYRVSYPGASSIYNTELLIVSSQSRTWWVDIVTSLSGEGPKNRGALTSWNIQFIVLQCEGWNWSPPSALSNGRRRLLE